MASNQYPEAELKELKKNNIRPYVIYIYNDNYNHIRAPNILGEKENAEKIKKILSDYGGRYFDVNDKSSMEKAYQSIGELEEIEREVVRTTDKQSFFQTLIFVGVLIVFVIVLISLLSQPFGIFP